MAKISATPPAFTETDQSGTLKRVCDYNIKLLEQLQFFLTAIEKRIESAIARMDKLNEKMTQLESQTDNVISAQNEMRSSIASLTQRVRDLESKIQ